MVRNYTVRRHIARLEKILPKDNLCKLCPANLELNSIKYKHIPWTNIPCKICLTFVGLKKSVCGYCPCFQLEGKHKEITLKAIKKFRLKSQ